MNAVQLTLIWSYSYFYPAVEIQYGYYDILIDSLIGIFNKKNNDILDLVTGKNSSRSNSKVKDVHNRKVASCKSWNLS